MKTKYTQWIQFWAVIILTIITMTGLSQNVPELLYYKFDEEGNQQNYASAPVGNNPATLNGLTIGNTGEFGTALIGNGLTSTSNRLNTGWATNLPSTGWTISFWIKNFPSVSNTTYYYFGDVSASTFRCFTGGVAPAGGLILRATGLTDVKIYNVPADPTVYHLVYTGSAVKVYKNGVYIDETAQTAKSFTGTGPFIVGGYSSSNSINAGTLMDEFRLYSRALTQDEITLTWNQPLPLSTGLTVVTQEASEITITSATGNGVITATNGEDASNRGIILYLYTDTDKEIGDADVTNFDETGTFGTGSFTFTLTPLTANTHYNARAHATNTYGTGYGARVGFWTLANTPSAPTVDNPTATSLEVAVNGNGNPDITTYAINETSTTNFVQANGTLGATAVWQTATDWGTTTVTGLTTGTQYTFKVKARNGDHVETVYSSTTNGTPVAKPVVTSQEATFITETSATGNGTITATNGNNAGNRGIILYPYTNTDKAIGDTDVSNFDADGTFGTGTFTFTLSPLTVNTRYNTRAHATNTYGTGYGSRVGFWTLANVPAAPTVNNPTYTTLDVVVNINENPDGTEFAIHETTTNKFVQADGTLGVSAIWSTATSWRLYVRRLIVTAGKEGRMIVRRLVKEKLSQNCQD